MGNLFFVLFAFLIGCKPTDPCVVDCLLPGMWSGEVAMQNNYLDIDTNLHIQLFEDENSKISGWIYHTDGVYKIQEDYSILHCEETAVSGDLQWAESGEIFVKCLSEDDGKSCLDFLGNSFEAEIDFYNFYGSYDFILDTYEEIGDAAKEDFRCVY